MKKQIFFLFLTLLIAFQPTFGKSTDFSVDSPQKAIFSYFPSPAILRCLNHSQIPLKKRKAEIIRKAKIDGKDIEQRATINIISNKFFVSSSILISDLIIPIKNNSESIFNSARSNKKVVSLEDVNPLNAITKLAGLQEKITVKDKIGNQELNYSTHLKNTVGKVGKSNYKIEITGQDMVKEGSVKYLISGKGNIGTDVISISGQEKSKDYYELNEAYGPLMIFTSIRVFD